MNSKDIKNGTYRKTKNGLTKIEAKKGYWVALGETTLEETEANEIIGIWKDEDGKTWVDKVVRITDLTFALTVAKTFFQKAIYDIANKKDITVTEK
jgi:hypothetical protein